MKKPIIFLVLILALNFVGMYHHWYLKHNWLNPIEHFSSGFFVAMLFSIYLRNHLLDNAKLKNTLILVGTVAFIGVIWEFSEYIASLTLISPIYHHFHIRTYFIGDLDDTLNDLLLDILGAVLFVVTFLHSSWHRKTAIKN